MKKFLCLLPCLSFFSCSQGHAPLWSQANPQTTIRLNPLTKTIDVFNSKDVSISIESFSGKTKDGSTWELKNLALTDSSSSVRQANVAQLEVADRITRTAILSSGEAIANVISEAIVPLKGANVQLETPIGSGSVTTGSGVPSTQPSSN